MPTDRLAVLITSLAATYVVHSTLFLAAAWLLLARCRSHTWTCRGWRFAALLGVVTAPLQLATGFATFAVDLGVRADPSRVAATVESGFPGHVLADPPLVEEADERLIEDPVTVVDVVAPVESVPGTPVDVPPFEVFATPGDVETAAFDGFPLDEGVVPEFATNADEALAADDVARAFDLERATVLAIVPSPRAASSPILPRVVAAVVLAMFAVGLVRLLVACARLRRWCGRGTPVRSSAVRSALARLRRANGIRRRVAVMELDDLAVPAACGLFRWTILLPKGLAARTSPAALEALLAHELAHLMRRDGPWLWFGHLLCGALAFQPLNFVARRRWRRASEFLCDAWAVRQGVRPTTLARCLTDLAAAASSHVPLPVVAMSAVDSKSVLVERVERLLEEAPRSPSKWSGPLFATCCLGLAGAAPFVPAVVFESMRNEPPDETAALDPAAADTTGSADTSSTPADLVTEAARREWRELDTELLALQGELERLQRLGESTGPSELESLVETLTSRREAIERRRRSLSEQLR